MKRYLLRSGHKAKPLPDTSPNRAMGKMVPASSVLPISKPCGEEQNEDCDLYLQRDEEAPLLNYKRLVIEVARQMAPDRQNTLELTLQSALHNLQKEVQMHTTRLDKLEERVQVLETENHSLHCKVEFLLSKHLQLEDHLEDLGNQSRHNNLQMVDK